MIWTLSLYLALMMGATEPYTVVNIFFENWMGNEFQLSLKDLGGLSKWVNSHWANIVKI